MKCELYQFYPEVYPFNLWIYVGKRERGYLSRTSRPRNAFSPPHPLRLKTGNAFLSQTYKPADYQQFI